MHLRIDDAGECKENTTPCENNDWLHRNDAYQSQPVCTPYEGQPSLVLDMHPTAFSIEFQGISKILSFTRLNYSTTKYICVLGGVDITNVSGALQSSLNTPPTNPVERKRKHERDRYMQMSPRSKEELLRKQREYRQQKKASLSPDDMENLHAKDKARYTSMSPNKRHAKINRGAMLRALRRDTRSHHSIAKENPLYTQIDMVLPLRESISVGREVTVDFGSPMSTDTPDGKLLDLLYNQFIASWSYNPNGISFELSVTNDETQRFMWVMGEEDDTERA